MYNIYNFLYEFGISSKTNFDLYDIARVLNLNIKVLMNNELDEISDNVNNYILNYQDSNYKGSHWVALHLGTKSYYFDSYGLRPTENVTKYLNNREWDYNKIQVQPFDTNICGIMCIYFLYRINKNKTFDQIIKELNVCNQ